MDNRTERGGNLETYLIPTCLARRYSQTFLMGLWSVVDYLRVLMKRFCLHNLLKYTGRQICCFFIITLLSLVGVISQCNLKQNEMVSIT